MRVVTAAGSTSDFRQAELDRHLDGVTLIERAKTARGAARVNPDLALGELLPAEAIIGLKDELVRASITAKAILARLEPAEDVRRARQPAELAPREHSADLIR